MKLIIFCLFLFSFSAFSMGGNPVNENNKNNEEENIEKEKKVLVHVLSPRMKDVDEVLAKELYKISLDEVINSDKFSLLMNNPEKIRRAKIKFLEIHIEIAKSKLDENKFKLGIFLADGNSGSVVAEDEQLNLAEGKLRFHLRKTLRNFFYKKKTSSVKAINEEIVSSDEISTIESGDEKESAGAIEASSGEMFNPQFEKSSKGLIVKGGETGKSSSSSFSKEQFKEMMPYTFKKKGELASEEESKQPSEKNGFGSPAQVVVTQGTSKIFSEQEAVSGKKNKEKLGEGDNYQFSRPEKMSQELSKVLEAYLEDPENLKKLDKIKTSISKKDGKNGDISKNNFNLEQPNPGAFKKTKFAESKTIYSVGLNFSVDKIESLDIISTTNNFKQIGISVNMDKYPFGIDSDKINVNAVYSTAIDYDENYELPASTRISAEYQKAFASYFRGGFGLEYEKQFFVNVAENGGSLKPWNNQLIWYKFGFAINFSLLFETIDLAIFFSKPFIGNTDYGGESDRTIDGSRIHFRSFFQIYKGLGLKTEVLWSEMTSQGLTNLKNTHLSSATYLTYSFL